MSLTKIGSIGINTGIQLAGVTTVSTLHVGSGVTLSSDGDVFATGISTFSEDIKVGSGITLSPDGDGFYTGVVTATTFSGALAASSLTGALPAISGANLTNLDASDLASGTVPTARLGSGTASSSTFLRGDSTFQTVNTDLVSDTSPQLGGNLDVNTKNIVFGDSGGATDDRLTFGAGTDLSIYHDASHSYIADSGTGDLLLLCSQFKLQNAAGSENMIIATENAGVQLLWDNSTKVETRPTGLRMQNTSVLEVNGGTIQFGHSSSTDDRLKFGANDTDLQIFHGGNGQFDVNTGDVIIRNTGDFSSSREIYLMARADEQSVTCKSDGAVELYHNNVQKLTTTANGTTFSNTTDDAAMNDCLLLTRRGYEASGYGTKIQVMGGSADSQNGIRFAHSHSNGGGYTVRQRFDHDGIKFNGDTAAANGLDDYEEGTWTPTISFTSTTNVSYSGSSRNAEYVKVGNLVYIRGFVSASGTGTNSGQIKLGGLPFTPNSGGYGRHAISMQSSGFALGSGNAGIFGLIEESAAQIDIYGGNASGTGINISGSQWNSAGMYFAGTYHVLGY